METRDLLNVGAFRGWLEEDHPELLHSLYKTWETHLDTMEMRRLLAEVTALPEAVTPATASPALPAGQLRQAAAASPAVEEEAAPAVASPAAAGAAPAQQPHASPDVIDLLSDAEEDEAVIVPAGTLPAGEAAAAAATADQAAPAPSEHNAGQGMHFCKDPKGGEAGREYLSGALGAYLSQVVYGAVVSDIKSHPKGPLHQLPRVLAGIKAGGGALTEEQEQAVARVVWDRRPGQGAHAYLLGVVAARLEGAPVMWPGCAASPAFVLSMEPPLDHVPTYGRIEQCKMLIFPSSPAAEAKACFQELRDKVPFTDDKGRTLRGDKLGARLQGNIRDPALVQWVFCRRAGSERAACDPPTVDQLRWWPLYP